MYFTFTDKSVHKVSKRLTMTNQENLIDLLLVEPLFL